MSLTDEQHETWFAYMRVMLRLNHEMNRQLQADSDLSLPDYHVLNALADSPSERLRLGDLAARIGWERGAPRRGPASGRRAQAPQPAVQLHRLRGGRRAELRVEQPRQLVVLA